MPQPITRWSRLEQREVMEKKLAELEESFGKCGSSLQATIKEHEDLRAQKNNAEEMYKKMLTKWDDQTLEAVKLRGQVSKLNKALEARDARIRKIEEGKRKIIKKYGRSNAFTKKVVDAYYEGFKHGTTGLNELYPKLELERVSLPLDVQAFRMDKETNKTQEISTSDASSRGANREGGNNGKE